MRTNQTPTVLVALILSPDQFGLLDEIRTEAIEVLNGDPIPVSDQASEDGHTYLFDKANIRMAVDWSLTDLGDMLTLAVGKRPNHTLSVKDARRAADMLRDLVQRAEALFEVRQTLWQTTILPLTSTSLITHTARWINNSSATQTPLTDPFYVFKPELSTRYETATSPTLEADFVKTMRDAIEEANQEPSLAMQVSALTLSTACAIAIPPIGIAMFTYAVLRQGTDMKMQSRKSVGQNNS